ncbi:MAG: hypothetical protein OEV08_16225 [Nitrospira sp.]|jgi:hypothetical protein|nr:hypothetical protein [Nitrospira sp.]
MAEGTHRLEEDQSRKTVLINVSHEAWAILDQLTTFYEQHSPGISPVLYGYFMIAGHVRLRLRVRIEGSVFKAIKPLLEEFNRSEESSTFMPLLPKIGKVQREARAIEISLPNDSWTFFENAEPLWSEAAPSTAPGIFLGWFMCFGLWWFKERWAISGNTATALKELLQEVMASGEIR